MTQASIFFGTLKGLAGSALKIEARTRCSTTMVMSSLWAEFTQECGVVLWSEFAHSKLYKPISSYLTTYEC